MKTIVTHSTTFHPDDLFAVALLIYKLEKEGYSLKSKTADKKIKVVRSLDPKVWATADFVVDIGRVHNPKKLRFDHHQEGGAGERPNGVPYASFGLVWKAFGKKLTGSDYATDWVDRHIVQAIDAMDNGIFLYTPTISDVSPFIFEKYIKAVCDLAEEGVLKTGVPDAKANKKSNAAFDKAFMKLLPLAHDVISVFITKAKQKEGISKLAKKAYTAAKDKRVIISDRFIPADFSEFPEPLVFVFPHLRGGWAAKVVTKGDQTYGSRISFPESWRGKSDGDLEKVTGVPGSVFCHNSGFLALNKTKEGVLELVAKAIKGE